MSNRPAVALGVLLLVLALALAPTPALHAQGTIGGDPGNDPPPGPAPPTIDARIYDGQGAANAVDDAIEETRGAVTVANLNDTDGDGVIDSDDKNGVVGGDAATAKGRDEVDLMKLVLKRPTGNPNLDDSARLTIIEGGGAIPGKGRVKLWTSPLKTSSSEIKTMVGVVPEGTKEFVTFKLRDIDATNGKTIWAEITTPSKKLRDVVLQWSSEAVGPPPKDIVKATAVWATATDSRHDKIDPKKPETQPWSDFAGNPLVGYLKHESQFGLGKIPTAADPKNGLPGTVPNIIAIQFTVEPAAIATDAALALAVAFDITRRADGATSIKNQGAMAGKWTFFSPKSNKIPPRRNEEPNDDANNEDESGRPNGAGHMYVFDAPGLANLSFPNQALAVMQFNFEEFMRVRFDGRRPGTGGASSRVDGSRCSPPFAWTVGHFLLSSSRPNVMKFGTWERVPKQGGKKKKKERENNQNFIKPGITTPLSTPARRK